MLQFLPEGWKVGAVSFKVRLPTYVDVSKSVKKALNLNVYRNLHHYQLNTQKTNFHEQVKPLLANIPKADKIWLHYEIFAPRNGRIDIMNVGSIVDKYFSDTLVEAKKILDDHFGHVVFISFSFGGVVPMDGHAIAHINILEQENPPMRILLDQSDIQTALENFVEEQGISGASGVELSIDGTNIVAEVTMEDTRPKAEPTTTKRRGGRPKGSTNKPKVKEPEVTDNVDEPAETDSDRSDSGSGESTESIVEETLPIPEEDEGTKNPSTAEDSQSSDSPDEGDTASSAPKDTKVEKKKRSIFNV